MSYNAIVARIHTRPHPNADKLLLGTVAGSQVVVGLDTPDGALGIYFPCDGQLSEEFCKVHDLIGYTGADGSHQGGFFAKNRRVRIQKLRGEKSDGFWVPLSYVDYTGIIFTPEGMEFTELNGHPICNKYINESTARALYRQGQRTPPTSNKMFLQHFETAQLKRHIQDVPLGALCIITEKLHGTSGRMGYVLDRQEPTTWRERLSSFVTRLLGINEEWVDWHEIHGSRRVEINVLDADGFHGGNFRDTATVDLQGNLHKGEVVYFEIVGYSGPETPIMQSQPTDKLKDKALTKQYGDTMTYSYGCEPGASDLYVYRITQVNEDGKVVELAWAQVKARCKELGAKHVPELCRPFVYAADIGLNESNLMTYVANYVNGPSTIDDRHIREGVVLRVEAETDFGYCYKLKSDTFLMLEDHLKSDDTVVDTEEAS